MLSSAVNVSTSADCCRRTDTTRAEYGIPHPNFLIIGAARSGTTTLYHYLKSHPDVYLPQNKRPEPHFFLKNGEYEQGFQYYLARHFAACGGQTARGEASTSYFCYDWVAQRIWQHLPDVKLIALLRNPIERAYSNYWHTVRSGLEELDFAEAIRYEPQRLTALGDPEMREIRPYAYIDRGFYARQIRGYLKHFVREQLHFVVFDDFVCSPQTAMDGVFEFLNVGQMHVKKAPPAVLNRSTPEVRKMSAETRAFLTTTFADDIHELMEFLRRDLGHWLAEG